MHELQRGAQVQLCRHRALDQGSSAAVTRQALAIDRVSRNDSRPSRRNREGRGLTCVGEKSVDSEQWTVISVATGWIWERQGSTLIPLCAGWRIIRQNGDGWKLLKCMVVSK